MAALIVTMRKCCLGLTSRSAAERKRSANEFLTLLSDSDLCQQLSTSTDDQQSDWYFVLDYTLSFFHLQLNMLEGEGGGRSSADSRNKTVLQATSLLLSVVRGACRWDANVNTDTLVSRVLQWLQMPQRRRLCAAQLCQVLHVMCLSCPVLADRVRGERWIALVDSLGELAVECFRNDTSKESHPPHAHPRGDAILKLLSSAVRHGRRQTALGSALRRLAPLMRCLAGRQVNTAVLTLTCDILSGLSKCGRRSLVCQLASPMIAATLHEGCGKKFIHLLLPILSVMFDCIDAESKIECGLDESVAVTLSQVYRFFNEYYNSGTRRALHEGLHSANVSATITAVFARTIVLLVRCVQPMDLPPGQSLSKRPRYDDKADLLSSVLTRAFIDCSQKAEEQLPWLNLLVQLLSHYRVVFTDNHITECWQRARAALLTCQASSVVGVLCQLVVCLCKDNSEVSADFIDTFWRAAVKHCVTPVCANASHALIQCLAQRTPDRIHLADMLELYTRSVLAPDSEAAVASLTVILQRAGSGLQTEVRSTLIDWLLPPRRRFFASGPDSDKTVWLLTRLVLRDPSVSLEQSAKHEFFDCWDYGVSCLVSAKHDVISRLVRLLQWPDICSDLSLYCGNMIVIFRVVSLWLNLKLVSTDDQDISELMDKFGSILDKLFVFISCQLSSFSQSVVMSTCMSTLETLISLLDNDSGDCVKCSIMSGALLNRVSDDLLNRLFAAASATVFDSSHQRTATQATVSQRHLVDFSIEESEWPADEEDAIGVTAHVKSAGIDAAGHILSQFCPVSPLASDSQPLSNGQLLCLKSASLLLTVLGAYEGNSPSDFPGSISSMLTTLCCHTYDLSNPVCTYVALAVVCTLPRLPVFCVNSTDHLPVYNRLLVTVCRHCLANSDTVVMVTERLTADYLPLVANVAPVVGMEVSSKTAMSVYRALLNSVRTASGGERFLIEFLRLTAAMCHCDPVGSWTLIRGRWVGELLLTHFACSESPDPQTDELWSSHISRTTAAHLVADLIADREKVSSSSTSLPSPMEMLQIILEAVQTGVAAAGNDIEQLQCRAAEFLLCVCDVCRLSVSCRGALLFSVFTTVDSYTHNGDAQFDRAMEQLSRRLGVASRRQLLDHVPAVCSMWLADARAIDQFPWRLLDFGSFADFLRHTLPLFVPHLLLTGGASSLERLRVLACQASYTSLEEALLSCVSHVFASVAIDQSQSVGSVWQHGAVQTVSDLLGEQTLRDYLTARGSDTVLLCCRWGRSRHPTLSTVLERLCSEFHGLVPFLLSGGTDGVQQVVVQLAADIQALTADVDVCLVERWAACSVFTDFVHCVAGQLGLLGEGAAFVTRYVCFFSLQYLLDSVDFVCPTTEVQQKLLNCVEVVVLACANHSPLDLPVLLPYNANALCCLSDCGIVRAEHTWRLIADACAEICGQLLTNLEILLFLSSEQLKQRLAVDGLDDLLPCLLAPETVDCQPSIQYVQCLLNANLSHRLNDSSRFQLALRFRRCVLLSRDQQQGKLGQRRVRLLLHVGRILGAIGPFNSYFDESTVVGLKPESYPDLDWNGRLLLLLHSAFWQPRAVVTKASLTAMSSLLASKAGRNAAARLNDQTRRYLAAISRSSPPADNLHSIHAKPVDCHEMWAPSDAVAFDKWIHDVTMSLLANLCECDSATAWRACSRLFSVCDAQLLASCLPDLCQQIVQLQPSLATVLGRHFTTIFVGHEERHPLARGDRPCGGVYSDDHVLRSLLAVLQHLREQCVPARLLPRGVADSPWQRHFWLPVNLRAAARAALSLDLVHECLLLAELWSLQELDRRQEIDQFQSGWNSDNKLQLLLLDAYEQLGDEHSVSTLPCDVDTTTPAVLRRLERSNCLAALAVYDGREEQWARAGMVRGLRRLQLFGSLHHQLVADEQCSDIWYEASWRLGKWHAPTSTADHSGSITEASVHASLFGALAAYSSADVATSTRLLTSALTSRVRSLLDVPSIVISAEFWRLTELNVLAAADRLVSLRCEKELAELCADWVDETTRHYSQLHYAVQEMLVMSRACMLQLAAHHWHPAAQLCENTRHRLLEHLFSVARDTDQPIRAHHVAQQLPEQLFVGRQSRARSWWSHGEHVLALSMYRQLIAETEATVSSASSVSAQLELAKLKLEYADWLAECHSESSQVIINKYLKPACEFMSQLSVGEKAVRADELSDAHHAIGCYLDSQFSQLDRFIDSPEFRRRGEAAAAMLHQANRLKQLRDASRCQQVARSQRQLEVLGRREQSELEARNRERQQYLQLAIDNLLRCLRLSDRHDILVYRLVALWLSEQQLEVTQALTVENEDPRHVSCHKWLPLIRQLATRLGWRDARPEFSRQLNAVLFDCGRRHPHHTLPELMALAHTRQHNSDSTGDGDRRVLAAQHLLNTLSQHSTQLSEHIEQLRALSTALIRLSNVNDGKTARGRVRTSREMSQVARQARGAWRVCVATLVPAASADGNYTDGVVCVANYESEYRLMGGQSAPKRVVCVCSDGKRHVQLVKGEDDLRQDAVMQQVFSLVNHLLALKKRHASADLTIRTYQVAPLSLRSGVIEWCANTQPLSEFLLRAHPFYRPEDMKPREAYELLKKARDYSVQQRRLTYDKICARLQPVMRHFFFEKFCSSARQWYKACCSYASSAAAPSMVGYILGIGDRHVNNILLDNTTAQLVHIDFGIAFEMGRLLPTPETVPFRLSRDLVDGLGSAGVYGRFNHGCQQTMHVLRRHGAVIVTLVRVLLDDPLYEWRMTDEKARRRQCQDSAAGDRPAVSAEQSTPVVTKPTDTVLARLDEKLRGLELGQVMSCEAQVNYLVQQARDPDNLSQLYVGWQPYL